MESKSGFGLQFSVSMLVLAPFMSARTHFTSIAMCPCAIVLHWITYIDIYIIGSLSIPLLAPCETRSRLSSYFITIWVCRGPPDCRSHDANNRWMNGIVWSILHATMNTEYNVEQRGTAQYIYIYGCSCRCIAATLNKTHICTIVSHRITYIKAWNWWCCPWTRSTCFMSLTHLFSPPSIARCTDLFPLRHLSLSIG